jgi:hypothetical protein
MVAGDAGGETLVERWRGGALWKRQANTQSAAYLNAISCASGSDCVAVGSAQQSGFARAFALHYDGSTWRQHTFSQNYSGLTDVSCTARACVAIGNLASTTPQPFVVRYAAGKWRTMTVPTPGAASTNYIGVDCWSGSSCRAVGSRSDDAMSYQTFAAVHP